jgi:hypothetical protein
VQLFNEDLRIRPEDFEYLRSSSEDFELFAPFNSFDEYAKTLSADCTDRLKQKLSMALLGTKSENMRSQCIELFIYLWKQRDSPGNLFDWKEVRRYTIEADLGYRRCGSQEKKKPFVNVLSEVLKRLERFGLIERIALNDRTVSYKISDSTLAEILTREEQSRRSIQEFYKQMYELETYKRRFLAIIWYLNEIGIPYSEDIIDQWEKNWHENRRGQDRTSTIEYTIKIPPLTQM